MGIYELFHVNSLIYGHNTGISIHVSNSLQIAVFTGNNTHLQAFAGQYKLFQLFIAFQGSFSIYKHLLAFIVQTKINKSKALVIGPFRFPFRL